MSKLTCEICPHHCRLEPGQVGLCRARANVDGQVQAINYGLITSAALIRSRRSRCIIFTPEA